MEAADEPVLEWSLSLSPKERTPDPQPLQRADRLARPRLNLLRDPHTLQPRPREASEKGRRLRPPHPGPSSLLPVAPGAGCIVSGNKGEQYSGCTTGQREVEALEERPPRHFTDEILEAQSRGGYPIHWKWWVLD